MTSPLGNVIVLKYVDILCVHQVVLRDHFRHNPHLGDVVHVAGARQDKDHDKRQQQIGVICEHNRQHQRRADQININADLLFVEPINDHA